MRGDNQHKRGRGERSTLTTMSRDRSRHAVQLFRGFHQKTGPTTQTLLYKGKRTRTRRSQTYTLKKRCQSSKVNRACRWRLAAAVRHDAATLTTIRLRFRCLCSLRAAVEASTAPVRTKASITASSGCYKGYCVSVSAPASGCYQSTAAAAVASTAQVPGKVTEAGTVEAKPHLHFKTSSTFAKP